jgi:hypothetical protein
MKILFLTPFPNSPSPTQLKMLGELANSIHTQRFWRDVTWVICTNAELPLSTVPAQIVVADPTNDSMVAKRRHLISHALNNYFSWDFMCWIDADDLVTEHYQSALKAAENLPVNLCCLHGAIAGRSYFDTYSRYQRWVKTNANESLSRGENPFASGSCLVWKPSTPKDILLGEKVEDRFGGVEDVCWAYFSKESSAKVFVNSAVTVRPSISYAATDEMERVRRKNLIRDFYKQLGYSAYNQIGYSDEGNTSIGGKLW